MDVEASRADGEIIELRLPPAARFASTLRVFAASLAAEEQIAIDTIADLRAAVHDVFMDLVHNMDGLGVDTPNDRLIVRFCIHDGGMDVNFSGTNDFPGTVLDVPATHRDESTGDRVLVSDGTITVVRRPRNSGAATPKQYARAATREPG